MQLSKLMPILMLLGIGVHSKEALTARLGMVMDIQYSMATQTDLNTLLRQAQLDSYGEPSYEIRDLAQFISQHIEKQDDRDVTKDAWGTPYRHQITGNRLTLASAGRDKAFGTEDDLEVEGQLGGE